MFFPKATGKYKHKPESKCFKEPKAVLMRTQEGDILGFESINDTCRYMRVIGEPFARLILKAKELGLQIATYDPFTDEHVEFVKGEITPIPLNLNSIKYPHDLYVYNIINNLSVYSPSVQLASSMVGLSPTSIINRCNTLSPWPSMNHCFMWSDDFRNRGFRFRRFRDIEITAFRDKRDITTPMRVISPSCGFNFKESDREKIHISKLEVMDTYGISRRTLDKLDTRKFILAKGYWVEYLR